jgi:alcohol dehydrogenase
MFKMYANNITLRTGITNARVIIPEALSIIKSGLFKPEKITTLVSDWGEAAHAFLENTVKVVVKRPLLYS